jgi:hypothetical protein
MLKRNGKPFGPASKPKSSQPPSGKNPDFSTPAHFADFREGNYCSLGQIHSYLGHGFEKHKVICDPRFQFHRTSSSVNHTLDVSAPSRHLVSPRLNMHITNEITHHLP